VVLDDPTWLASSLTWCTGACRPLMCVLLIDSLLTPRIEIPSPNHSVKTVSCSALVRPPPLTRVSSVDEVISSMSSPARSMVCYTNPSSALSLRMNFRLLLAHFFTRNSAHPVRAHVGRLILYCLEASSPFSSFIFRIRTAHLQCTSFGRPHVHGLRRVVLDRFCSLV
jgi:hypothetical protein